MEEAAKCWGVGEGFIALFPAAFFAMAVPMALAAGYALQRRDLRFTVLLGAWLVAGGALFRMLSSAHWTLALLGQTVAGDENVPSGLGAVLVDTVSWFAFGATLDLAAGAGASHRLVVTTARPARAGGAGRKRRQAAIGVGVVEGPGATSWLCNGASCGCAREGRVVTGLRLSVCENVHGTG
jgi:hypothetical protein